MKKQVCLLGGEVIPNVIGALYERPEAVLPIATEKTAPQAEFLRQALRACGFNGAVEEPAIVLPYDEQDCVSVISKTLAGGDCSVNWTGGTKVMAWAARRVAGEKGLPVLYVNSDENLLLQGGGKEVPIDTEALGLNVMAWLLASGHTIEGVETLGDFRRAYQPDRRLVAAADRIFDLPPEIRYGDVARLSRALDQPASPRNLSPADVKLLLDAQLIQPAAQPAGSFFLNVASLSSVYHRDQPQAENAKFLMATYWEVVVWNLLVKRGGYRDASWHVRLNPRKVGRGAEFDILLFGNNRFLVVECKNGVAAGEKISDLIEETSAKTRRIGRLFSRWILAVNRYREELNVEPGCLESWAKKAEDYAGTLLFRDDLDELPRIVETQLNRARML